MRRDYHPYLSHAYLTRSPRNHCLRCGGKMGNIAPSGGRWHYWMFDEDYGKQVLLGYVHSWDCTGDDDWREKDDAIA